MYLQEIQLEKLEGSLNSTLLKGQSTGSVKIWDERETTGHPVLLIGFT